MPPPEAPAPDFRGRFLIPIYNVGVWFIIASDMKEAEKKLPKKLRDVPTDGCSETCRGTTLSNCPDHAIILDRKYASLELIAHEADHLCLRIMADIGFAIHADNDEPLAYLKEFVTGKLISLFSRK